MFQSQDFTVSNDDNLYNKCVTRELSDSLRSPVAMNFEKPRPQSVRAVECEKEREKKMPRTSVRRYARTEARTYFACKCALVRAASHVSRVFSSYVRRIKKMTEKKLGRPTGRASDVSSRTFLASDNTAISHENVNVWFEIFSLTIFTQNFNNLYIFL